MTYKAKLKQISSVDAGGFVDVWFEVLIDGENLYPNMHILCKPEEVEATMEQATRALKEQRETAELIPDDLEITI
ncbi:TPA: hypothetical protein DEB29_03460 [Candidatus Wolfebacteria bacterium]|nr:hypothetical protein [Candidatus Wolfebacteria bacterium]